MPKFIDFSGKRIGRVQIISLHSLDGRSKWYAKCDCSRDFICTSYSFCRGETFECEFCRQQSKRGEDLTDRKFGRWTVLKMTVDCRNKTVYECKCDCGKICIVVRGCLGNPKKSMSCGCWGRKKASKYINDTLYPPCHGLSRLKFYQIKTSLIHKCYNEKHPMYFKFGANGISVCELWKNGVKDMFLWAKENNWNIGDVIILKEGKKIFSPENCLIIKFNDYMSKVSLGGGQQITYKNETHSVRRWGEILNVNAPEIRTRLKKYQSIDEVFDKPFKKNIFSNDLEKSKKVIELYNDGKTQTEISKITGITVVSIAYHLKISGIKLRKDTKRPKKPSVKNEDILELLAKDMTMNSIAKKLGCSFPTIKFRIDSMNGLKRDRSKG